jgi:PPOX class probable F420-dependent enzyme
MHKATDSLPLATQRYVSLATCRRDGTEVRTPVWIVTVGALRYVYSSGDSGKVKRLRNNPHARMAACSMRGEIRGDWVEVCASFVRDAQLKQQVFSEFRRKYGVQFLIATLFARLARRDDKRVVMALSVESCTVTP